MLTAYSLVDSQIETIDANNIVQKLDQLVWIDLNSPSREEEQFVEKLLDIDIPTPEEMAGLELSNRLYQEDDATFMVATLIARVEEDKVKVIPYIFVLTGKHIVTVRYNDAEAFRVHIARLKKRKSISSLKPDMILLDLLEAIVNRLADVLEASAHKLDLISKDIFCSREIRETSKGTDKSTTALYTAIRDTGLQGDMISMTKESLISLSRLVGYARQMALIHHDEKNRDRCANLATDVSALSEHTTFLTDKANFLLDATVGMIGIQQNAVMKIFTILAVFFMPPTLIAGIYGMNFKHMPELEWFYGYPLAIGIMLLSAYVPYRFFKRRGWL